LIILDTNEIDPGRQVMGFGHDDRAQPPTNTVSDHGVSNLFADCVPNLGYIRRRLER
jgi:hypothetical protein